ncbi:hypothetical protein GQ600_9756 [Phytophthora cactorum]|nr:hypothetical protein GQ600_9756 [Phytophthora cactorum]
MSSSLSHRQDVSSQQTKRHAMNLQRKLDGSFYRLKINKNLPARPPSTGEQGQARPTRREGQAFSAIDKVGKAEASKLARISRANMGPCQESTVEAEG